MCTLLLKGAREYLHHSIDVTYKLQKTEATPRIFQSWDGLDFHCILYRGKVCCELDNTVLRGAECQPQLEQGWNGLC